MARDDTVGIYHTKVEIVVKMMVVIMMGKNWLNSPARQSSKM